MVHKKAKPEQHLQTIYNYMYAAGLAMQHIWRHLLTTGPADNSFFCIATLHFVGFFEKAP